MRTPPAPTAARVLRLAEGYLDRFGATEASLRGWLERKTRPAAEAHGTDPAELRGWIGEAVERLRRLGFLDDRRWAESRARVLRRRGASTAAVRSALAAKGVAGEIADEVLGAEEPADPDLEAARTYARKHHLGPWRPVPVDADGRRRELSRLGRRGFAWDVARRVVDASE